MDFSYAIVNGGVRIRQVLDPSATVIIPEEIEGFPVTELEAYVLSGSRMEELHLPSGLRKIGAYAFYNCENLKRIYCYSRVLDLGTGLFAGAGNVEFLDLTLFPGEKSCLKEMLSELRQTLRVWIHEVPGDIWAEGSGSPAVLADGGEGSGKPAVLADGGEGGGSPAVLADGEKGSGSPAAADRRGKARPVAGGCREARLVFPEYYEESVENTPARILYIETHGCGHRYRYCFVKTQFQYRDYDDLFLHVQVQEPEELVTELALGRLMYPCGLSEHYKEMYREYVAEHWLAAGRLLIGMHCQKPEQVTNLEAGRLPWLLEQVLAWDGSADVSSSGAGSAGAGPSGAGSAGAGSSGAGSAGAGPSGAGPSGAGSSGAGSAGVSSAGVGPIGGADGLSGLPKQKGNRQELAEKVRALIDIAQQMGDTESVSWLMDFRQGMHREKGHGGPGRMQAKRRFEL